MELCDFCSVMKIIRDYISDSRALSQSDLMYEIFASFMADDENEEYDFDNAQVCRWMNGQAAISPKISKYYQDKEKEEVLVSDVYNNLIPILYDASMCVERLHDLLMLDDSISHMVKSHISEEYPCNTDIQIASVIGRTICFIIQRKFVKHGSDNELAITEGRQSPAIATYILGCEPPLPCRFFVGRQDDIERIHTAFSAGNIVILHGVAGMGKSETAKAYARKYKKEFTNQIYIRYSRSLKKDIANLDFGNDPYDADEDSLFRQHNRFLRSLKEDSLLIIDNYSESGSSDPCLSIVIKYRCRVLITTRNLLHYGEDIYIDTLPENDQISLMKSLCGEVDENSKVMEKLLFSVHGHTFAVELIARLLRSGIMTPEELNCRLDIEPASMPSTDKITISKDGTSTKATYAEHIRTLFGLFDLAPDHLEILKCAVIIPYDGTSKRYFARWLGHNDLNTINELIELGFFQELDGHRICLHELIQDLVVAEFSPGINDCRTMLSNIQECCTYHGVDNPPFYNEMACVIEMVLMRLKYDDKEFLLRFLEDAYAYYDRPYFHFEREFFIHVMDEIVKSGVGTIRDRILLLDCKASHFREMERYDDAIRYEKEASELITEVTSDNALLYSNIHANLGGMYLWREDMESAQKHIEEGLRILKEFGLMYTHDTISQACNFAIMYAKLGNEKEALRILTRTEKYVKEADGECSLDFAALEESIGAVLISAGQKREAIDHFIKILKIHADLYEYDRNILWDVAYRLSEYFPDKADSLSLLTVHCNALCDYKQ